MAEPLNLFELLAAPQRDASLVEGGEVGAFRRPANVSLCPALQTHKKQNVSLPQTNGDRRMMFNLTRLGGHC